jgi:hypothetical protein
MVEPRAGIECQLDDGIRAHLELPDRFTRTARTDLDGPDIASPGAVLAQLSEIRLGRSRIDCSRNTNPRHHRPPCIARRTVTRLERLQIDDGHLMQAGVMCTLPT